MNGDDVRVVQGRDGERFARESLAAIGIGRGDFRQNFQGDLALEPKIAGAVDSPIPPAPSSEAISYDPNRVPGESGMLLAHTPQAYL